MTSWTRAAVAAGVLAGGLIMTSQADAQFYYPRGYGGYGFGGWGADPASGYMAGLGSFARGRGAYEVDDAKARAINTDTMIKWNKALRARQQEVDAENAVKKARERRELNARVAREELESGFTLNNLLNRIFDFDPAAVKSARTGVRLSASGVREIPFEWNSEAVGLCLDQMLGRDALPDPLNDSRFADQRDALGKAVRKALDEDAKGNVSPETSRAVADAVDAFRKAFAKTADPTDPGYYDAGSYLTTLAGLTRLLNDPSLKTALVELEKVQEVTVGQLVAFMQSYNLRFGPATTERQVEIYGRLARELTKVADDISAGRTADPGSPGSARDALPAAARGAFGGLGWKQLDAHAQSR